MPRWVIVLNPKIKMNNFLWLLKENIFALFIIGLLMFIIYAKMQNKSLKDAFDDIINLFGGDENS